MCTKKDGLPGLVQEWLDDFFQGHRVFPGLLLTFYNLTLKNRTESILLMIRYGRQPVSTIRAKKQGACEKTEQAREQKHRPSTYQA